MISVKYIFLTPTINRMIKNIKKYFITWVLTHFIVLSGSYAMNSIPDFVPNVVDEKGFLKPEEVAEINQKIEGIRKKTDIF